MLDKFDQHHFRILWTYRVQWLRLATGTWNFTSDLFWHCNEWIQHIQQSSFQKLSMHHHELGAASDGLWNDGVKHIWLGKETGEKLSLDKSLMHAGWSWLRSNEDSNGLAALSCKQVMFVFKLVCCSGQDTSWEPNIPCSPSTCLIASTIVSKPLRQVWVWRPGNWITLDVWFLLQASNIGSADVCSSDSGCNWIHHQNINIKTTLKQETLKKSTQNQLHSHTNFI